MAYMDVDTGWDTMTNRITSVIDLLCPIKTFKFSNDEPKWLTNDIILLIKNRDRCL